MSLFNILFSDKKSINSPLEIFDVFLIIIELLLISFFWFFEDGVSRLFDFDFLEQELNLFNKFCAIIIFDDDDELLLIDSLFFLSFLFTTWLLKNSASFKFLILLFLNSLLKNFCLNFLSLDDFNPLDDFYF